MKLKKMIALALGVIMALSLAACNGGKQPAEGKGNVKIPDPFTEHETLADAEKEAGFRFNVPGTIQGFDECVYRFNKDTQMLEVIFKNGDEEIRFRKAVGEDDPSGNFSEFSEKESVEVNGITATMKGADGKVSLATWSVDGYAYSIDCSTAVNKATMTDYIKVVSDEELEPIGGDSSTWGPPLDEETDKPLAPPSPFVDCDTMTDAAKLAGFEMALPETPDALQAWEGHMIQAFYGEDGKDMLIRKAVGNEDVSGDYNEYAQVETVDGVTLKGENDAFSLAIWEKDGYTYSISVGEALAQADMMALVAAVQ